MQKGHTAEMYNDIIGFVEKSIHRITHTSSSNADDEKVAQDKKNALVLLNDYKKNISANLLELQKLSEWDVFTIAVYGETNAGKSTIIETLRILLGDPVKQKSQAQFRQIAKSIQFDAKRLTSLQNEIQQASLQKNSLADELQTLVEQHALAEAPLLKEQELVKSVIEQKLQALGLWQKFVHLFKKFEEEHQLAEKLAQFREIKANHQSAESELRSGIDKAVATLERGRQELAKINENLGQLTPYQDGEIIGNGRSDFTLASQSYYFEARGQKFALIDVPGIEGDEKKVSEAINGAVKKAHAVLYITRKPSPPNKGEAGALGTVEKIRQQLGNQTEVWAIYNKGVTNPMALQAARLVNEGEAISLQDLEKELEVQLEKNFKGCISLSALPAFYAATDCLVPTNSHFKNQQKFLTSMGEQALLEKSGFASFVNFISHELCHNYKDKIVKANVHKVNGCIQDGLHLLEVMINTFSSAKENLEKQLRSTARELDNLEDSIARRLKSRCRDKLSETKTQKRQDIYSRIDQDISNDEFKQMLERRIDSLKDELADSLKGALQAEVKGYEDEVREIVTRFMKNADELLELNINRHFGPGAGNFKLEFKIDNGINKLGLLSSLGGAAGLVWAALTATNPILLALSAVTLLFSFYKAVRSFFSSSYKKEQQRKSADENLAKVFDKIEEKIDQRLSEARTEISKTLGQVKGQLSGPLDSVQGTLHALRTASNDIGQVATKIA